MAFRSRIAWLSAVALLSAWTGRAAAAARPSYRISAAVDYDLLMFRTVTEVRVRASPDDPLSDVVLFAYANAGGIGGDDDRRRNMAVDGVEIEGRPAPFGFEGPVLRVRLPGPRTAPFTLRIEAHGVVPRDRAGGGDLTSGLGGDLAGLLGGGAGSAAPPSRPKNPDFGLYSYGNGILSLGSFWYPQVAVRRPGGWVDRAPEGLGDVAFAEMSDYDVEISAPSRVRIAATGIEAPASRPGFRRWTAANVRDFAVLMSEDFIVKSRRLRLATNDVLVEAFVTRASEAQADRALDVAAEALRVFSRRFGAYPYGWFRVVEGPIRGGAGGMEFSGLTSVSSMVFRNWTKALSQLAASLGLGDLDKILGALRAATGAGGPDGTTGGERALGEALPGIVGQPGAVLDSLLEMTIAHEVAHQWWAIRVGSDSVSAPFVDESLANYTAILYFEDRYGRETARRMMDLHVRAAYRTARLLGVPDAAVNLATAAYRSNLQYGAVVYGKGALFYEALRAAVGDAVFFGALREYGETYAGKLAGPRSLVEIVRARAPAAGVEALYRRWIEETHGDEDVGGGAPAAFDELLRRALTPEGRP